jgi:integrase
LNHEEGNSTAANSIELLKDLTRTQLGQWRGEWGREPFLPDGAPRRPDDRFGPTTQSQFLGYLKRFFSWAEGERLIPEGPARHLGGIRPEGVKTVPLDQAQFDQVMSAVERRKKWSVELKAIFLVQRWTGLRVIDVLTLRRDALTGNRLSLITVKTKEKISPILPPHVCAALDAVPPRKSVRPDCFFWSPAGTLRNQENRWLERVARLNDDLSLVYPRQHEKAGRPMRFRSHMLRDTYAVEMLLAGVPLEKVSKLLGHRSMRVTEMYYAHWTEGRLKQLDDDVMAAFQRQGVALLDDALVTTRRKGPD